MQFLPTAYALVVAGLDLAVAALCWGWPRGELWPLGTRTTALAIATAGLTAIGVALLVAGIQPAIATRLFVGSAIFSFTLGTVAAIPPDAPKARRKKSIVAIVSVPVIACVLVALRTVPGTRTGVGVPPLLLTLPSALLFGAACGGFQLTEAWAIVTHWPRSQLRSSTPALLMVFLAGFIDIAALLGAPLPMVGAVTAAAISSAYIASRMLAQFRVALQGAEGRVPGYALQHFLGAGGMAEVFMAEAVGILGQKRVAAVKRVRRDLVDNVELCAMFLEEARIAAELHHPNIVEVYSYGTGTPGSQVRPYIAMELVDGLPLAIVLRHSALAQRPLPLAAVAEIGAALCAALHYAHTLSDSEGKPLSIVHRDVSPHNVLISRTGDVKLIDFGIARAATRVTHTKTGHMRGKLAYAAPEQVAAGVVDARTDVYSLGVLLYEAAALTRPFAGESEPAIVAAIMEGKRKSLLEVRPDAGELAEVIERAMALRPDERWPDARSFGDALGRAFRPAASARDALAQLVSRVEGEKAGSSSSSGPAVEVAATTLTSSAPASGETATVEDPASVARGR